MDVHSNEKITLEEVEALFGSSIPMEAAALLMDGKMTIVGVRQRLVEMAGAARRFSFDAEWFLQGIRMNPGEYEVRRLGPALASEHPF